MNIARILCIVLAGGIGTPTLAQSAQDSDYQSMLGWLASSRIEDKSLSGASGAIAINQAAGDNNLQANLRAIAIGQHADVRIGSLQRQYGNHGNAASMAEAIIGGGALAQASGLVSINQASGSGNTELNSVSLVLAQRGIREADDEFLSSAGIASAGVQIISEPGGTQTQARKVSVEGSALRGFEGVLQLNQVVGGRNMTENNLSVSIQGP